MDYIYLIFNYSIQVYLLWNWLRIIDTTSGKMKVGMRLKKIDVFDVVINSFWILYFLLIPLVIELNASPDGNIKHIGMFLTSLIFGKFFWDSILPGFGDSKGIKMTIWLIIWGPIANLITGVLIIKIGTYLIDTILDYAFPEVVLNSLNAGLNFLSDIWVLRSSELILQYQFSLGLAAIVSLILTMRILPLYMMTWKKIILICGVFTLVLRTIKYVGGDFSNILNIGSGYLDDSYSKISILIIAFGWFIAVLITRIKKREVNEDFRV